MAIARKSQPVHFFGCPKPQYVSRLCRRPVVVTAWCGHVKRDRPSIRRADEGDADQVPCFVFDMQNNKEMGNYCWSSRAGMQKKRLERVHGKKLRDTFPQVSQFGNLKIRRGVSTHKSSETAEEGVGKTTAPHQTPGGCAKHEDKIMSGDFEHRGGLHTSPPLNKCAKPKGWTLLSCLNSTTSMPTEGRM